MDTDPTSPIFWPLGVYAVCVITVAAGMLCASYFLGQRTLRRRNVQPYESGIASTGSARVRMPADFYLFAVFFVVFDLESVVLYSWSIAVVDLGWVAYAQVCVFVAALVAALAYLWRTGALDTSR